MKKYEKPVLMAFSLNGNERLCGDCADRSAAILVKDNIDIFMPIAEDIGDRDVNIERSDFDESSNTFGNGECEYPIAGYCKFTSVMTIAWS